MSARDWTDADAAIVRACIADGLSADDAARRVGPDVTRDMVTGYARRAGLSFACAPDRHREKCRAAALASWAGGQRRPRKDKGQPRPKARP